MRRELRIAGFGGQGVIKAAVLTALAAGLNEDKEVAQTQSYGPEARGGACRSDVVVSDQPIDYIKPMAIDAFVVMSQPALDKYIVDIDRAKTLVIADSTLVTDIPADVTNLYLVEATRLAEQELGAALYANIIMLGALTAVGDLVGLEALAEALDGAVPAKTLATNRRALDLGRRVATERIKSRS